MSIIYTLVSNKKDNVLVEHTTKFGNFQPVSRVILTKAVENDMTQVLDCKTHKFHYINEEGVTYLCMSEGIKDETIISFLKDVQKNLLKLYDIEFVRKAPAYKLSAFEKQIQELVEYYETNPRQSVSGEAIIKEINEAKALVVKNITQLLERENNLEITISNSNNLKESAIKVNHYVTFLYSQEKLKIRL